MKKNIYKIYGENEAKKIVKKNFAVFVKNISGVFHPKISFIFVISSIDAFAIFFNNLFAL